MTAGSYASPVRGNISRTQSSVPNTIRWCGGEHRRHCLVDQFRQITQYLVDEQGSQFTDGALLGKVSIPIERELTFYVRHGELRAQLCRRFCRSALCSSEFDSFGAGKPSGAGARLYVKTATRISPDRRSEISATGRDYALTSLSCILAHSDFKVANCSLDRTPSADFMNLSMLSLVHPPFLQSACRASIFTFCSAERLSFA